MSLNRTALDALKTTSRTFFIPISRLPDGLQEAIGSAYLCMRAIDEIEDHVTLAPESKVELLNTLNLILQAQTSVEHFAFDQFEQAFQPYQQELPEVTIRLGEWA